MMSDFERDGSGFAVASHQAMSLCLWTLAVAGALTPVALFGFGPLRMILGWLLAAAGVYAGVRAAEHWRKHKLIAAGVDPDAMSGNPALAGADMGLVPTGNPQVRRLLAIVASISDTLIPKGDAFEFDGDDMIAYGFVSTSPGFFATETAMNKVNDKLSAPFGDGWRFDFDSTTDTFTASRKSSIPSLVTPELWPVVTSREQAAAQFGKFAVVVGVGESGPIAFKPKDVPHREMVGATGGGKSVAARAELMQYFAGGYRLFAIDGKGTDYSPFVRFPNVTAVSSSLHEHVVVIHLVWQILQQRRRNGAAMSKRGDTSWRETMTPILLMIDEFASVRANMKTTFSTKEIKLIERDIVDILKVGREFRVNVILATQDMKADTVPSDWQDMFKVVQSLGRPGTMTVNKAFPEQIRGEVSRLGGTISPKTPGRALVTVADDSGKVSAQLYQSFWSYSPAETISNSLPDGVRENWAEFKTRVADRIPRLYPRMWVDMEYPWPQDKGGRTGSDPYAEQRAAGWTDLSEMGVEDLHRLKPVNLEDPVTLEPVIDQLGNDPLAENYRGNQPLDAAGEEIPDY